MEKKLGISVDGGENWKEVVCSDEGLDLRPPTPYFQLIDKQGTHLVFVNWFHRESCIIDAANEEDVKEYELGQRYEIKTERP